MSGARIVSQINDSQDYDFLFEQDNKLDTQDENIKSALHEIEIFGNKHIIAMGNKNLHPKDETIEYFICYLIYDSQVVSKIGVYELNVNDTITLDNADFSKMELLIDNYYYKNPESLLAFRSTSMNVEKDLEEETEENIDKELREEDVDETKEGELKEGELEEGELEENKEENLEKSKDEPITTSENQDKSLTKEDGTDSEVQEEIDEPQKTNTTLLEKIKEIFDEKEKKSAAQMFNLMREIRKNKQYLYESFDSEYQKLVNISDSKKAYFVETFFDNKSQKITKSLLTMFEYMLNIKFILVNEQNEVQQFSIFDNIETTKLDDFFKNSKVKMNAYWNNYNPNKIILVTKNEDDTYEYVDTIDLQQQDINSYSNILNSIKTRMDSETHEYEKVSKQKLSILKSSFDTLN